jgi:hypothetical protein
MSEPTEIKLFAQLCDLFATESGAEGISIA